MYPGCPGTLPRLDQAGLGFTSYVLGFQESSTIISSSLNPWLAQRGWVCMGPSPTCLLPDHKVFEV